MPCDVCGPFTLSVSESRIYHFRRDRAGYKQRVGALCRVRRMQARLVRDTCFKDATYIADKSMYLYHCHPGDLLFFDISAE